MRARQNDVVPGHGEEPHASRQPCRMADVASTAVEAPVRPEASATADGGAASIHPKHKLSGDGCGN
jgi:hypothetical protein